MRRDLHAAGERAMMNEGCGTLAISVDLELDVGQQARSDGRGLDAVTQRLAELLGRYQLPATWGVADPALSAATEAIVGGPVPHEMAILGDPTWVGRSAGRTRFARELERRTAAARAAGLPATSLLLRDVVVDQHLDLLVKHGITLVRGCARQTPPAQRGGQLELLRYGVWQTSVTCQLPGKSGWMPFCSAESRVCRAIERASENRAVVQLRLDARQLVGAQSHFAAVERVLRLAQQRRQAGELRVETLEVMASRMLKRPQGSPTRSVLCPAA